MLVCTHEKKKQINEIDKIESNNFDNLSFNIVQKLHVITGKFIQMSRFEKPWKNATKAARTYFIVHKCTFGTLGRINKSLLCLFCKIYCKTFLYAYAKNKYLHVQMCWKQKLMFDAMRCIWKLFVHEYWLLYLFFRMHYAHNKFHLIWFYF